MDSCNVMRGYKNALRKQIKENLLPNLLDIGWDSSHDIHNAAKNLQSILIPT